MFSRKPQTILTSKKVNSIKTRSDKRGSLKEALMTAPSEVRDLYYVSIGGVSMPISK